MTSHLSYLLATQRMADLTHSAEQTRRTKHATESSEQRTRSGARTVISLKLRGAPGRRLRVRRA